VGGSSDDEGKGFDRSSTQQGEHTLLTVPLGFGCGTCQSAPDGAALTMQPGPHNQQRVRCSHNWC